MSEMRPLEDIARERRRLLCRVGRVAAQAAEMASRRINTIEEGISMLSDLRSETQEEMNQIQHAALISDAASALQDEYPEVTITWKWHPEQSGDAEDPDLQGDVGGETIISAEATASKLPEGAIDTRMREKLDNLPRFHGKLFYCVRTAEMWRRARTKIRKAGYDIEVKLIPCGPKNPT